MYELVSEILDRSYLSASPYPWLQAPLVVSLRHIPPRSSFLSILSKHSILMTQNLSYRTKWRLDSPRMQRLWFFKLLDTIRIIACIDNRCFLSPNPVAYRILEQVFEFPFFKLLYVHYKFWERLHDSFRWQSLAMSWTKQLLNCSKDEYSLCQLKISYLVIIWKEYLKSI